MLMRLRSGTFSRIDDQQEEIDPGRARHHRPDKALVPWHIDERQPAPICEIERCVAEVDRDPPPLLLRQPVRVLPGQGTHEPCLPVIDVPRSADRQRHGLTSREQ